MHTKTLSLRVAYNSLLKGRSDGWMDGWVGGSVDGWVVELCGVHLDPEWLRPHSWSSVTISFQYVMGLERSNIKHMQTLKSGFVVVVVAVVLFCFVLFCFCLFAF